jgi:hypothetical protein
VAAPADRRRVERGGQRLVGHGRERRGRRVEQERASGPDLLRAADRDPGLLRDRDDPEAALECAELAVQRLDPPPQEAAQEAVAAAHRDAAAQETPDQPRARLG